MRLKRRSSSIQVKRLALLSAQRCWRRKWNKHTLR